MVRRSNMIIFVAYFIFSNKLFYYLTINPNMDTYFFDPVYSF
jgi:hypothetical protein